MYKSGPRLCVIYIQQKVIYRVAQNGGGGTKAPSIYEEVSTYAASIYWIIRFSFTRKLCSVIGSIKCLYIRVIPSPHLTLQMRTLF